MWKIIFYSVLAIVGAKFLITADVVEFAKTNVYMHALLIALFLQPWVIDQLEGE